MSLATSSEDWVSPDATIRILDEDWLQSMFPHKEKSKIHQWLQVLHRNEFESSEDLLGLTDIEWEQLPLPLAIKSNIRRVVELSQQRGGGDNCAIAELQPAATDISSAADDDDAAATTDAGTADTTVALNVNTSYDVQVPPQQLPVALISQIDCVVLDISGSMKARSSLDIDKTREDVSKLLFHSLTDKIIALEMDHAVGLLAFGAKFSPFEVTTEYERFHDHLGRLDATENRTLLYDALLAAADIINDFASSNGSRLTVGDHLKKRIFVLTDGEDNGSQQQPWRVARKLQQHNITVDAIPLAASSNSNCALQSIALATGGLFFQLDSQAQAMQIFENDATLHIAFRELQQQQPPVISDSASFIAFVDSLKSNAQLHVTRELRTALPASAYSKVMRPEEARCAVQSGVCKSTAATAAVTKRILKEYADCMKQSQCGVQVFMNADDITQWKLLLCDLPAPYIGGVWVVAVEFPAADYPLKPLKWRFLTPIYHCNIAHSGGVCLDVLRDRWSPAMTVSTVITSILSLLSDPNGDDPLDAYKGQLFKDDKEKYLREARDYTLQYASESLETVMKKYQLDS